MEEATVTGQTKNVGFEIGARKTFPVSFEEAWNFLFSNKGLPIWLGQLEPAGLALGQAYETTGGITGKVTVWVPMSHIRLRWKKKEWNHYSILQMRLLRVKEKTTISFHQEHLQDTLQRNEMSLHWKEVLAQLNHAFTLKH